MSLLLHAQSVLIRLFTWLYDLLQLGVLFNTAFALLMRIVELDVVPDFVTRRGIRLLLKIRLISVSDLACGSL